MKKLLLIPILMLVALVGYSQTTKLTVNIKFVGIEEGYDHETKSVVLIDGEEIAFSPNTLQSKTGAFTVDVPQGSHQLKVVNYALYEGNWEEHTVANEYSIDCLYEETHTFKKPEKLYLLFDIDSGTTASWKKPVKMKK
ncbi:hypothetical protein [Algoriphagus lacus]|nr:hypothetical protein [Algoriphagus lacus]